MSVTIVNPDFQKQKPCFPSCFEWRPVKSRGSAIQKSNTDKTYNLILPSNSMMLRVVFLELFLAHVPLAFIRIPLRIIDLLSGNFIESGKKLAQKKWRQEGQIWSLNKTNKKPTDLNTLITKYILYELVKNIAKIAFYPIAVVGMLLASLYGVFFNPWDGREIYSFIEGSFARELPCTLQRGLFFNQVYRLKDYLAICMQPDRVWEDNDFLSTIRSTHPTTIRSCLRSLSVTLREHQEFLENEQLGIGPTLNFLKYLKLNAYHLSSSDQEEWDGKLLNQTLDQIELCEKFLMIQDLIQQIINARDQVIKNEIQQSSTSEHLIALSAAQSGYKASWKWVNSHVVKMAKSATHSNNGQKSPQASSSDT